MHLNQPTLLALLQGRLNDDETTDALGHLAFCDDCSLRMTALKRVASDFEGRWDEFVNKLSGAYGEVTQPELARDDGTPRRVLAFAVRVLLDTRQQIAAVGTRLVADLVPSSLGGHLQLSLGYGGVGDPDRPPDIERLQAEAAELCGQGQYEQAEERLRSATRLRPDAAEIGDARGNATGGIPIEVMVDASRGVISVLAHVNDASVITRPEEPSRLQAVLLQPDGTPIRREPFSDVESADYWLAEFGSVPDGRWVVGVDFV